MSDQKLTKVKEGKWIAGVCTGIAKKFNINVMLVRIIWLVLGAAGSVGCWIYLAAMFILPKEE